MPFTLTPSDQQIAQACVLLLYGKKDAFVPDKKAKKGSPEATADEGKRIRYLKEQYCSGERVNFQFPPKVTSDNRDIKFETVARYPMPAFAYPKSVGQRKISLNWTYIVTHTKDDNSGWNVNKVSAEVRKIRGYTLKGVGNTVPGKEPTATGFKSTDYLIYFKYGLIAGAGKAEYFKQAASECGTFYAEQIDVKHSETLINENDPSKIYPLRTDISITLNEWISGLVPGQKDTASDLALLMSIPNSNWF